MKIVYSYVFQTTKQLKRGELLPCVGRFIEENRLRYRNVLFDLHTFRMQSAKGRTYLERLALRDPFWVKTEIPSEFDGQTDRVFLSGAYPASETETVIDRLMTPMSEMPSLCSYKICFDGMNWFSGSELSETADLRKYDAPLTSNITVYNYAYNDTSYVSLNFAMNENGAEHITFAERFSTHLSGLPYRKEIGFILSDSEKESLRLAGDAIKRLLENRQYVTISVSNRSPSTGGSLKLKASIRKIFHDFHLEDQGNGVYEAWRTDVHRNKISVVFDYDRENHAFIATLFYVGASIKNAVRYSEIQDLSDNDTLGDYLQSVREDVRALEDSYAPRLAEYYPKLPEWFEW